MMIDDKILFNGESLRLRLLQLRLGKENVYYTNYLSSRGSATDFIIQVLSLYLGEATNCVVDPNYNSCNLQETGLNIKQGVFILPSQSDEVTAYNYLCKQHRIPAKYIGELIKNQLLYQDKFNNCVFPCYDNKGVARGAILRGAYTDKVFKGRVLYSDAAYGWTLKARDGSNTVIVCKSPIDAISYMVMNNGAKMCYILALGTLNMAPLQTFLREHREITQIIFALDNDEASRIVSSKFIASYKDKYDIQVEVPNNQDWNADLQKHLRYG
jgi:hypothetical protein